VPWSHETVGLVPDEAGLVDALRVDHLRSLQDPHGTWSVQRAGTCRQLERGYPAGELEVGASRVPWTAHNDEHSIPTAAVLHACAWFA
jgi:hypothetical protein